MAERRSLAEGIKQTPTQLTSRERDFVYGDKPSAADQSPAVPANGATVAQLSRVPISTRMRGDFAQALKRASLQRQLAGTEPNTLQDILEEAVEPWLRNNGYLSP
jgi:hypothetical protein